VTGVYCTNCGHLNPEGANFCASCGSPLAATGGDRTLRMLPVDPQQDAPGPQDDVVVDIDEATAGPGAGGPGRGDRRPAHQPGPPLTRLGRHPQSDVSLDDITVSPPRRDRAAGRRWLRGRRRLLNRTYVNGERVEKARLRNGDEVQIGSSGWCSWMRSAVPRE
jgi:hypothetical protein